MQKIEDYIADHLGSVLNTKTNDGRKAFSTFGENLQKNEHDDFEFEKNSDAVIYGFAGSRLDPESVHLTCGYVTLPYGTFIALSSWRDKK